MKELTTYNRAAGYLNKLFDLLNERYFEGCLEKPVITIQSTPKAFGHYTMYDAWSVDNEKGMREINVGAGTLARPIENIVATLLHEMVHYFNDIAGIKDCSRGGTYHNKKFKELAEACDLLVDCHPTYGWTLTAPSDALIEFCLEHDLTEIRLTRHDLSMSIPTVIGKGTSLPTDAMPKKKSSTRKYICPCCGMSVRATKEVRIACMDCGEQMVVESALSNQLDMAG